MHRHQPAVARTGCVAHARSARALLCQLQGLWHPCHVCTMHPAGLQAHTMAPLAWHPALGPGSWWLQQRAHSSLECTDANAHRTQAALCRRESVARGPLWGAEPSLRPWSAALHSQQLGNAQPGRARTPLPAHLKDLALHGAQLLGQRFLLQSHLRVGQDGSGWVRMGRDGPGWGRMGQDGSGRARTESESPWAKHGQAAGIEGL